MSVMESELPFRLVLIAGFVTVFPVAAFYRIRSQMTGEKLDRRQEGWFILLTLRPVALVWIAALIAWAIDPVWMAWSRLPLPFWLRWTGAATCLVAGGLLIWTLHRLGRNLTDTVVTREKATLVTQGPYRWVRHPFYVAFALSILGNSLLAANWFLLGVGLVSFSLIVARTATEERKLLERFGDDYREYMRHTGRFFPRLG